MFVDKATVLITAGKGGDGFVSFRHEKFVDRGGPDGGDGGDGGDIVAVASNNQNTLAAFRYKKEVKAPDGVAGSKRKKRGPAGKRLVLQLPVGTVISNAETGDIIADLAEEGAEATIAEGGKGGFGNAHFVSSRRQAPRIAEKGEPGQELQVTFELKMIADVGLVGLPNAGKSTLLSRISNARPEIANYPFTTLVPQLGVVDIDKKDSLLVADIPGLIEGASTGKGLGDEFLRHVERTKVLIHLIDAYSEDLIASYKTIVQELKNYQVDLSKKPQIVAINKVDGMPEDMVADMQARLKKVIPKKSEVYAISAQSGEGLAPLLHAALRLSKSQTKSIKLKASKQPDIPVLTLKDTADSWTVEKKGKKFIVTGQKIERFARRTDFDNPSGVERLRDIMRKTGIMHELERQKINPGEKIVIGEDHSLEY